MIITVFADYAHAARKLHVRFGRITTEYHPHCTTEEQSNAINGNKEQVKTATLTALWDILLPELEGVIVFASDVYSSPCRHTNRNK